MRLGTKIERVERDRVFISDGTELASDLTVWAAGISGPEWIGKLGLPTGNGGRLLTGPDLRVADQDRIFAVGDIGVIDGDPLPQLSAPAIQQGRHVADQIKLIEAGRPTKPFRYRDKGIAATIGHRSAVVELSGGIKLRGTLAWLGWLGLHLFYLLGGRNRISALVNLSWRYLTWSRGGGVIIGDDETEPPAPELTSRIDLAARRQIEVVDRLAAGADHRQIRRDRRAELDRISLRHDGQPAQFDPGDRLVVGVGHLAEHDPQLGVDQQVDPDRRRGIGPGWTC